MQDSLGNLPFIIGPLPHRHFIGGRNKDARIMAAAGANPVNHPLLKVVLFLNQVQVDFRGAMQVQAEVPTVALVDVTNVIQRLLLQVARQGEVLTFDVDLEFFELRADIGGDGLGLCIFRRAVTEMQFAVGVTPLENFCPGGAAEQEGESKR